VKLKNKEILLELLHDAEDFAKLKSIKCPPIYLLGGSGCIIGEYFERATTDIDFIDMDYPASVGKVFRLFEKFDMLDLYVCPIAKEFETRAIRLKEFAYLEFYVLSREDIIVSKLSRYEEKDREDIGKLMNKADKQLVLDLIEKVKERNDFSSRVKTYFIQNVAQFKEMFYV
jgi:hypothetical protein